MTTAVRYAVVRGVLFFVLLAFLGACGRSQASGAPEAKPSDAGAMRIVSVGGAVTEVLFALGAGSDVFGIDTSSVYPEAAWKLPHVGYQRTLAAEGILSLRPTLVIATADAGPPAVIEQLRAANVRVEILPADPTIEVARSRILSIAKLVGRDGTALVSELDADLARAKSAARAAKSKPKVLAVYARGANVLHVLGKGTPGEVMVELAGGDNAGNAFDGAKPMTAESLVSAAPDVVLVPSRGLESLGGLEGLAKLPGMSDTPAGRASRFVAMDDLLLLGFGPRTGKALLELTSKIHPELGNP
ncbi:Heme ABC transporter, cell surface heme and hemoprotein receptor HmuT [Labilithrix luteola]|uniref:Heme ABC transporter, cell surface heme and hemoprotein receptor HmuT n=1 Tax=Labilithrix luteola TaxID=1391654 RepID=A0A0K1QAP3_9BACT|nr:ABC transporter substrate-binding protein [Labilithrix luteola]AKV02803.1 Heme ABC transporter, cell surface heme and hemoprotein receptor HmuT [Labilithrix luteola]